MLKQIKIKNFRNINKELVIENLENTSNNVTIFSGRNSAGKSNIINAVKKSIGTDFFSVEDFSFENPSQDIKISFNFDKLEMNNNTYNDFELNLTINNSNPFAYSSESNIDYKYNNIYKKDLVIKVNELVKIVTSSSQHLKSLKKIVFASNSSYNAFKRGRLLLSLNHKDEAKNNNKVKEIFNSNNLILVSEIITSLEKSSKINRSLSKLREYVVSRDEALLKDLSASDKDIYKVLANMFEIVEKYFTFEKANNIDYFALSILRDELVFVDAEEFKAKTVNIVSEQGGWLTPLLNNYGLEKEELFKIISEQKNLDVVEKIKLKILSVFNEFFRIVKFKSNIKSVKITALKYDTHEAIIVRLLDRNNNAYNLEQFGSGLLSFVFLIALMIKDKQTNAIFMIEDLLNDYSPKTKDKVLKFLQNNIKGKVIYTTNSLTDHERFETNTKLINLDDTPIDTLKELALLKELSETRRQLLKIQDEVKSLEEEVKNAGQEMVQKPNNEPASSSNNVENEQEFVNRIKELENEVRNNSFEKEELMKRLITSKSQYEELKDNYEILLEREQAMRASSSKPTTNLTSKIVQDNEPSIEEVLMQDELEDKLEQTRKDMIDSQRELTKISFDYKMLLDGYNDLQQKIIVINHEYKLKDLETQKTIQNLNNQISKSEADYDGIYSKIYLFEQTIEKLEEINGQLTDRNQELELENQKLSIQLDNQVDANNDELVYRDSRINQKQQVIDELEEKHAELREQLEFVREKNYLLETRFLQTQLLVDKIESSKVILKDNLTQRETVFKNRIKELEKEANLLNGGIDELRSTNKELEKILSQVKIEKENLVFENEQMEQRLSVSNEELVGSNKDLENELEIKETEIRELEEGISKLEKELMTSLMTSKHEINASETTIAKLTEEKNRLEEENEKINNDLKHLKIKTSNQEVVEENNKKIIEGYESEIEALSKLNAELETELNTKNKEESKILSDNDKKLVQRDETIKTLTKQIEKLTTSITRQEEVISKYKDEAIEQRENIKVEREENKLLVSELRDQIRQLNATVTDKNHAYESLEKDIDDLKEELVKLNEETVKSEKLMNESLKTENELKNEITERTLSLQKQERELSKLTNEINRLKQAQEKDKERSNDLLTKNKELRSEKTELNSKVNELAKRLSLFEKDVNKLEAENNKLSEEVTSLTAESTLKLEKSQKENLDLLDEVNNLKTQVDILGEQLESTQKLNEDLSHDLEETKNSDKKTSGEVSILNSKLKTLEKQLESANKQSQQKDAKNEKLASELENAKETKRENTTLNKQVKDLEKQIALFEKHIAEKDTEIIKVQEQLSSASDQVSKELSETQKTNIELNKQVNKLQTNLEKLTKQLETKKTQSETLKEKQKQLNEELKTIKAEKRELEKATNTPNAKTTTVVDDKEVKKLEKSLDKIQKENEILKAHQKDLKEQLKVAKETPSKSENNAKATNNQVQLLQFKNEELKNRVNRLNEQLKQQQEVLKVNNLLDGLDVDSDKKSRLVLTTSQEAIDFIKWLATKEEILLSEFNYEFGIIPESKEDIDTTKSLINSTTFDQIFIFADYTNESKKIYTSEVFDEMKKEYSISQLKPYYWNMMRNKKQITDEKIPANKTVSFNGVIDKLLLEAKISHDKTNSKENLNLIKVNFETNEALYRLAKKEYGLDKLIKLLKTN